MEEKHYQDLTEAEKSTLDSIFPKQETLKAEDMPKRFRPGDEIRLFSRAKAPRRIGKKGRNTSETGGKRSATNFKAARIEDAMT